MSVSLAQRHRRFYDLHQQGLFIMPNPWDRGSARMMAAQGAQALGTSSALLAFSHGLPDGAQISRDQALSHAADLLDATGLPVSADLEHGYGSAPEDVAESLRLAAEVGLSGASIEDTDFDSDGQPAFDFDLACARVHAGAAAVKALGREFIFCARADGVMLGHYDMAEALRRVQAFAGVGADMVYIPMLPDERSLQQLLQCVSVPVNVLGAGAMAELGMDRLQQLGVRRVSLGSMLGRSVHRVLHDNLHALFAERSLAWHQQGIAGSTIDALLQRGTPSA